MYGAALLWGQIKLVIHSCKIDYSKELTRLLLQNKLSPSIFLIFK